MLETCWFNEKGIIKLVLLDGDEVDELVEEENMEYPSMMREKDFRERN